MDEKKRLKYLANAEEKFQKEQLQAATAAEHLSKASAIVELHKHEVPPQELESIVAQIEAQHAAIAEFLLNARDKYAAKLKELGDPRIDPETGEMV